MAKRKCPEDDSADPSDKKPKRSRQEKDNSQPSPEPKRKSSSRRKPSPPQRDPTHFTITTKKGDLFSAPSHTLLVHACNTLGHWGAGIAAVFRDRYPHAYERNKSHCTSTESASGTTLLVPPEDGKGGKHFVGCLYTSAGVGRRKDPVAKIVENTEMAWGKLLQQVAEWNDTASAEERREKIARIWLCKINSGLFKVPWKRTMEVLRRVEVPESIRTMEVVIVSRE